MIGYKTYLPLYWSDALFVNVLFLLQPPCSIIEVINLAYVRDRKLYDMLSLLTL